ncbi:MAG: hypothetical protein JXA21_27630 [Anaerolineae bacterium]|nr:hypothetical protein [Anaerolineae bacterium]
MSGQVYNWKRFWHPRENALDLLDGGYLCEPITEAGFPPQDLVPLEHLTDIPCLILLGEPGIGKSCAMQLEKKSVNDTIKTRHGQILWLNLRSYGSEDRLVRDLFETSIFISWLSGNHKLHVFLDSLDECLLRIDTVATLLIDKFAQYPVDRLYLRIACRTADWPTNLEEGLKKQWGEEAVKVYELAPLTRGNVVDAARANELSPDDFLREIDRTNVVSLAIKPITLKFLLTTYAKHKHLPGTQAELYLEGCRLLCEESNEDRRTARLTGTLSANQRMIVAARIAAMTTLCNRNAIWTDIDYGNMPSENVNIQDLCGGSECADAQYFQVTETIIQEALATGLFSSRGPRCMGWAHQTYAEFLTAWYLVQRQMPLQQISNLVMHSSELGKNLIPQLHETAAWIAGMMPEVFQSIMQINPEVLLRSDVTAADIESRITLVDILLKLYDEEELSDRDWTIRESYRKLRHPNLAKQLLPYILDNSKGIIVRRVAVDIAEACELQEIQEDLLTIVLNPLQPYEIRVNSAWALYRIADETTKAKLIPLISDKAGVDPDDDLKGCALRMLWPQLMSAETLFAVLTRPKNEHYKGAYQIFLRSDFIEHLNPADLPFALQWTERLGAHHELLFAFQNLVDAIFWQVCQHHNEAGILDAFAKAIWVRLQWYDNLFASNRNSALKQDLLANDEKRHLLIKAILSIAVKTEGDPVSLAAQCFSLVANKDVRWMIEYLHVSPSEKEQRILARLIRLAYDEKDVNQQNAVYEACQDSSTLAQEFTLLFGSVELNSPQAQYLQGIYEQEKMWQEERDKWDKSPDFPPVEKWVHTLLMQFESGDLNAWWKLTLDVGFTTNHTDYPYNEFEPDITKHPGWQSGDSITRERLVRAAQQYIMEYVPETWDWIGTNTFSRPALAGYKALRLLIQEDFNFVREIPIDIWKRWAPAIVASPVSESDTKIHQNLVKIAYDTSPDEVIEILMRLVDHENADKGLDSIYATQGFGACWDDRFTEALLQKSKDPSLKPGCVKSLLQELLEHKAKGAREFAESLICIPLADNVDVQANKTILAAQALMTSTEDAGWNVVWSAVQKDAEFGRRLFSIVADTPEKHSPSIAAKLSESQLADLYIWLSQQFPHTEDPKVMEVHRVTPRESGATWREALLQHLQQRGTVAACSAIRRIAEELPELEWMKWALLDAQNIARRKLWEPPHPKNILAMAQNQQVRFVQSGDELLNVVIESLKRLECKLHDETPAIRDIWDVTADNKYKPVSENEFSDYIKRHLDEDLNRRGIIANREVELRRGGGDTPGERTDIHVDAIAKNLNDELHAITVIIEVKGCWHKELETAMQTQLVERYLKDKHCQHGLYLISWFNCGEWDDADYRKGQSPALCLTDAQKKFDGQATELSRNTGVTVKAFVMNAALH